MGLTPARSIRLALMALALAGLWALMAGRCTSSDG
jgi:hypothetical protein